MILVRLVILGITFITAFQKWLAIKMELLFIDYIIGREMGKRESRLRFSNWYVYKEYVREHKVKRF